VPKMSDAEREKFFSNWATADARYVDGMLILICKNPLEVRVVTHFRGRSRPITSEEAAKLEADLRLLLKENKNDEALLQAVSLFRDRLYNFYGETSMSANFDWATLSSVLLAVVGAWLALHFLHGFSEGAFRAGSAGINPLGLSAGIGVRAGLRAVREGLARLPRVEMASPHAATVMEDGKEQEPLAHTEESGMQ
jgi:hypothetical protein